MSRDRKSPSLWGRTVALTSTLDALTEEEDDDDDDDEEEEEEGDVDDADAVDYINDDIW